MFKTTNIKKQLFWDDVRHVCIQNDYYTCGDVKSYERLLDYVRTLDNVTEENLFHIALDIFNHSDIERICNECGIDRCGVMESILFNLTEVTHTFYKVEEV